MVIFQEEEFVFVADRAVLFVDSTVSNSNSKRPAKLMILPGKHYIL
jgi:hypothetical protein